MHFLFPADPTDPSAPDEFFADQLAALTGAGFSASFLPEEALTTGNRLRGIPAGGQVIYRGWMLSGPEYARLADAIAGAGGMGWTSPGEYLAAHHLPKWYPLIADLTPETVVFPADADLATELLRLGWPAFFVKDYVKSVKTSVGSLIRDPCQVDRVVAELRAYRGEVEGGVCVRRVEEFVPGTELRYFVVRGRPFAADGSTTVPEPVQACAGRIPSPFFSVDVARRQDSTMRVVEVGDGQVSDLVGWTPAAFADMWLRVRMEST